MKTNKFFGLAAIVCGAVLAMSSCTGNQDSPVIIPIPEPDPEPEIVSTVIGFEGATLNADGYWCGDETGEKFDNFGSDGYACSYKEDIVNFPVNWTPAWASWSGFAVSNRTETTYAAETMTPDQFNNITGKAHGGKNFMVVYTFGEQIEFDKPVKVKGFWYTNEAWTVDAILNGDGMSPGKFEAEDFLNCVVYPTPAENVMSGARLEIPLAKDGDYVKEWKYCDLSDVVAFHNIKALSFGFEGTKRNDYGLTTPTYICIDDIEIEYEK
ncbi:MAG: DUF4465 domain-containing protein [Prevotella sp.]|nr:DUF4465 domain-containing protein [Prevotella sp.]